MALNQKIPSALAPVVDPKTGVITKPWQNYLASQTLANAYPIGSIYTTTTAANPIDELGFGTWTLYAAGPPAQWQRQT